MRASYLTVGFLALVTYGYLSPMVLAVAPPEFVPTNEWQDILPGQSIPPGLDVKMNIYTGEKKARLLQPEAQDARHQAMKAVLVKDESPPAPATGPKGVDRRRAAADAPSNPAAAQGSPVVDQRAVRRELDRVGSRAAVENLQHHEALRQADLSDYSKLRHLLAIAQSGVVQDVIDSLLGMEEIVHSVDKAHDFVSLGGLPVVLRLLEHPPPTRNNTSKFLRTQDEPDDKSLQSATSAMAVQAQAAWLIGTLTQNARKVQAAAQKEGVCVVLERILKSAFDTYSAAASQPSTGSARFRRKQEWLMGKLVFAMSSAVRSNPEGQTALVESGGLRLLGRMIETAVSTASDAKHKVLAVPEPVARKIIGLVDDLIVDAVVNAADNASSSVALHELQEPAWCHRIVGLLDIDSDLLRENVLRIMRLVRPASSKAQPPLLCASEFQQEPVKEKLRSLARVWGGDPTDEFAADLRRMALALVA